jgi:hypothetical protein
MTTTCVRKYALFGASWLIFGAGVMSSLACTSMRDSRTANRRIAGPAVAETFEFQAVGDGRYRLSVPVAGLRFEVDRLRRDRHELFGELTVHCDLPGARTVDGVLSVGTFNLSSPRARQERAKLLREMSDTELDFAVWLEVLSQRTITTERTGQPAVLLRDIPKPSPDDVLLVDCFPLLMRHPVILFGDGSTAKSYFGLYLAGRLEQEHGVRVGLFDWELAGEDHRDRGGRLFGDTTMPAIRYVRCVQPLVHELDRLKRIVRDEGLDYVILDSVAFACDGPPESAEVAARYFQSVRQLGILGSLHIAHISKAEGADQKPFGSTFWHNGARATWNVKLSETIPGSNQITIGLYNRKANLGGLKPAIGYEIVFTNDTTTFKPVNVADVSDLAGHLSVRQRMAHLLRRGAMSPDLVADEIGADLETVKRTARRYKNQFTVIPGGNLALLEKRAACQ